MNSRILQITLIIFLCLFSVILGSLIVLDRTKILPLDSVLSFLPFSSSDTTNKNIVTTPPQETSTSFSLIELTPVPKGDQFNQLIKIPGEDTLALTTVSGTIQDISNVDNTTYLSVIKNNGELINEILPVYSSAEIIIVTVKDGKGTEQKATIADISKGDHVMVSYNIDQEEKTGYITGVRIYEWAEPE